ncbi:SRPBCC family protein [Planococcus shenhongbingii]|uniref:SRPBCC family protein n=1 Tax=Planococcus shenhongbingii TaxID=3058398 RepID=A0ABT8NGE0_9BACL|nr:MULTISPECIES: SRPBCC family protein [unclassified Planococcus (in: firmicutes)]MDN7246959.1 SRPBCC family protein [Planococcus sp. N017]WKA56862.1 SRPBCC family protein [Planococcus sp. N016]
MVKWKEQRVIPANIETVWNLFSDKNIKRLMPKIEDHILLENNDDEAGAKHAQSYYEGKQLQNYIVETIAYEDLPERKYRHTSFTMSQLFQVAYYYTLEKVSEEETLFIYEGTQKGLTLTAKAMLLSGSKAKRNETVQAFMDRVETEATK